MSRIDRGMAQRRRPHPRAHRPQGPAAGTAALSAAAASIGTRTGCRSWTALFARSGHALVVVGAAHLVGPDGLLAMFKAKGYRVEQL